MSRAQCGAGPLAASTGTGPLGFDLVNLDFKTLKHIKAAPDKVISLKIYTSYQA